MKIRLVPSLLCFVFLQPVTAMAVDCKVVSEDGGNLLLKCDGKLYFAMSEKNFERQQKDYADIKKERNQLKERLKLTGTAAKEVQKLSEDYRNLSVDYASLNQKYKTTLDNSVELNDKYKKKATEILNLAEQYDGLVKEYNDLTKKYRDIAISGGSFIQFDVGLGVTSNDGSAEGAALIGMSISKVNVWGFLQRDNSGVLVGTSFGF